MTKHVHDFDVIRQVPTSGTMSMTIRHCRSCGETGVLTITQVTRTGVPVALWWEVLPTKAPKGAKP